MCISACVRVCVFVRLEVEGEAEDGGSSEGVRSLCGGCAAMIKHNSTASLQCMRQTGLLKRGRRAI